MLHDGNSGNITALQNQRAVSAYLLSEQILYFHFPRQSGCHRYCRVWDGHSEACIGYLYTLYEIATGNNNQSDLKIFIFRRQIYIILIYLLQRPYFIIVVLK